MYPAPKEIIKADLYDAVMKRSRACLTRRGGSAARSPHPPGSSDPSHRIWRRGPVADRGSRQAEREVDAIFRAILVDLPLVLQLAIVLTGIVSRFWFDESLLWADEAAKLFLSLTAFVGGALAFRARHHTTVEFLTGKFSPRWKTSFAIGIDLLILVAAKLVGYVSLICCRFPRPPIPRSCKSTRPGSCCR